MLSKREAKRHHLNLYASSMTNGAKHKVRFHYPYPCTIRRDFL